MVFCNSLCTPAGKGKTYYLIYRTTRAIFCELMPTKRSGDDDLNFLAHAHKNKLSKKPAHFESSLCCVSQLDALFMAAGMQ